MSTNLPWNEDSIDFSVYFNSIKADREYYVVIENMGDIPDIDGEHVDFTIISGSKQKLIDMGYSESNIFSNINLAFLSGALDQGYFDGLLKDSFAYKHLKKS